MPADDPERVILRARAYADEQLKSIAAHMAPTQLGDGMEQLLHAAMTSAFFVGYGAGANDATSPRAAPLGGVGERRRR